MMTPSAWIALATLCLVIMGAVLYIGKLIGSLPGMIAAAIRTHEVGCSNHEANSSVRIVPANKKVAL